MSQNDQIIPVAHDFSRLPAVEAPTPPPAQLAQVVEYVEPQKKTKTVAVLDDVEDLVKLYDKGVQELNEMGARLDQLRQEIIGRMGDAQSGVVRGVEVFTHNLKKSYRTTDLRKDYPELAAMYMKPVTKDAFDVETFVRHHPGIAARYQAREFRRTGGIQVIR